MYKCNISRKASECRRMLSSCLQSERNGKLAAAVTRRSHASHAAVAGCACPSVSVRPTDWPPLGAGRREYCEVLVGRRCESENHLRRQCFLTRVVIATVAALRHECVHVYQHVVYITGSFSIPYTKLRFAKGS